jgi:hypothetical protein
VSSQKRLCKPEAYIIHGSFTALKHHGFLPVPENSGSTPGKKPLPGLNLSGDGFKREPEPFIGNLRA